MIGGPAPDAVPEGARRYPWGPVSALIGFVASLMVLLVTTILLAVFIEATDRELVITDIGDTFEKAGEIARYADEKLSALSLGAIVEEPPELLADQFALRGAMASSLLHQVATIGIIIAVTQRTPRELLRAFKMTSYQLSSIWRPAALATGAYVFVVLWGFTVTQLGLDFFEPESTVPYEVVREPSTLILTGLVAVIGAPFAEEFLYRGLMFGGLSRWGFWPAAAISGFLFSAVHLDPGSFVPFFMVGMALAWIYWSRGNLWDAIAFHFMFNGVSFIILASLGL